MSKVLVLYYSRTGNTKAMAEEVSAGAREKLPEDEVTLASVEKFNPKDLADYEAIILGSPTYYGIAAAEMKEFLDESITIHGDLAGKIGAAFSSCGIEGGGSETTCLSLIKAMLVHGMCVRGFHDIGHYGPVSTGEPGERARSECHSMGQTVAEMVK